MYKYLRNIVVANNFVFKSSLHVHIDIPFLSLTAYKYFSLACNYPKGKGDQFKSHMKKNYPRAPLVRVLNGGGSQ